MASLNQTPTFVEFFLGRDFAAKLDAIGPAIRPAAEEEARPTAEFRTLQTASDEAFFLGYTLGYDFEPAAPPADYSPRLARHFKGGWEAGKARAEKEELEAWLDELHRREMFEGVMSESYEMTESERWNGGTT